MNMVAVTKIAGILSWKILTYIYKLGKKDYFLFIIIMKSYVITIR